MKELSALEKYVVTGGVRLKGEVSISGAKNAAVAIIPAAILADGPCIIENVPNISDVSIIIKILHEMGAEIKLLNKNTIQVDCSRLHSSTTPKSQPPGMETFARLNRPSRAPSR